MLLPPNTRGPAKIALIYAALAAIWILTSDSVAGWLTNTPEQMAVVGTLKGWTFVAFTSVILYKLTERIVNNLAAAQTKLNQEQTEKIKALRLLEVISQKSTDAIYVKDAAGRYLLFNPGAARLVGKSSAEVLGLDDRSLFPSNEAEELMSIDRAIMDQGEVRTLEETITTALGATTFLTTKGPFYDDEQNLLGIFGIARDITERKAMEEALKLHSELLIETQALANIGYYIFNVTDNVWESSDILDEILGIDQGYSRTVSGWLDLVAPEMRSEMAEYLTSIMATSPTFNYQYVIQRANDGERRWVDGRGSIDRDQNGRPFRMIGTIQDITERVNSDNAIREKAEQLTQSNAELEQFAYVASHDLQTPLRNIIHYAQLLERRYKGRLDQDADSFIDFIIDGSRRMTALISDLLEYSRISNQSKPMQPVSAAAAAAQALDNLASDLNASGAEISLESLPLVMAEPSHLASLFQNLLENALKYRSPDRRLVLSVSAERTHPDWWRFAVSDNGIGIEPQYFDKVFEIFQRLNSAPEAKGTGIGLTLCRRIVQRFGGSIWMESMPNQGTTVYFTLRNG